MIRSKLPQVGTTIFTVMSKLAAEHQATNLGQGFPNFPMDEKLANLVHKRMLEGFNQYAPMQGMPELRQALAQKIKSMYGHEYDWNDEITITAGGTQAIYTAITALVHEGDEVLLFAPAYDCYAPAIELCGATPIWYNLKYPSYKPNWDEVKKLINHRTRMIVINTPHNPSGAVLDESDMLALQKLVAGTDIIVLSDEVYEHLIFDGAEHQSVTRFSELVKQSMAVYSFGKTFHNTGWKMGYITGPAPLMNEFRKVHQFNVFSCNTPVQLALTDYLQDASTYLQLPAFYEAKRNLFVERLKGSRFTFTPAAGTYFQLLNYADISSESDTELAVKWTKEQKITGIPCSVFYPEGLDQQVIRFCFAKNDETLVAAASLLRNI
jgi:methionine aminotransferase